MFSMMTEPHRMVDAESGMTPAQEILGEAPTDQPLVQEQLQHSASQVLSHPGQIAQGDEDEAARCIEAALQDQGVEVRVWVEPQKVARRLVGDHRCGSHLSSRQPRSRSFG